MFEISTMLVSLASIRLTNSKGLLSFVILQPALYPQALTRMMTRHPSPVWTLRPRGRDSRSTAHSRMKTARNTSAARRCARPRSSTPTPGLEPPRMMNSCESYSQETPAEMTLSVALFSYFWMTPLRKNMEMVGGGGDYSSVVWAWCHHWTWVLTSWCYVFWWQTEVCPLWWATQGRDEEGAAAYSGATKETEKEPRERQD